MNAPTELTMLREQLTGLAAWASERLDGDFDRQYIAEYLLGALLELQAGQPAPPEPF